MSAPADVGADARGRAVVEDRLALPAEDLCCGASGGGRQRAGRGAPRATAAATAAPRRSGGVGVAGRRPFWPRPLGAAAAAVTERIKRGAAVVGGAPAGGSGRRWASQPSAVAGNRDAAPVCAARGVRRAGVPREPSRCRTPYAHRRPTEMPGCSGSPPSAGLGGGAWPTWAAKRGTSRRAAIGRTRGGAAGSKHAPRNGVGSLAMRTGERRRRPRQCSQPRRMRATILTSQVHTVVLYSSPGLQSSLKQRQMRQGGMCWRVHTLHSNTVLAVVSARGRQADALGRYHTSLHVLQCRLCMHASNAPSCMFSPL